jgi:cell division protein FtsX
MESAVATSAAADAAGAVGLGILGLFQATCCFGYLFVVMLMVALMAFWIYALVDVVQRADAQFPEAIAGRPSPNEKLVWILVVILIGWIGALIYYFVVMRKYPRARMVAS